MSGADFRLSSGGFWFCNQQQIIESFRLEKTLKIIEITQHEGINRAGRGPGWQHPNPIDNCLNIAHKVDLMKYFLLGSLRSVVIFFFLYSKLMFLHDCIIFFYRNLCPVKGEYPSQGCCECTGWRRW